MKRHDIFRWLLIAMTLVPLCPIDGAEGQAVENRQWPKNLDQSPWTILESDQGTFLLSLARQSGSARQPVFDDVDLFIVPIPLATNPPSDFPSSSSVTDIRVPFRLPAYATIIGSAGIACALSKERDQALLAFQTSYNTRAISLIRLPLGSFYGPSRQPSAGKEATEPNSKNLSGGGFDRVKFRDMKKPITHYSDANLGSLAFFKGDYLVSGYSRAEPEKGFALWVGKAEVMEGGGEASLLTYGGICGPSVLTPFRGELFCLCAFSEYDQKRPAVKAPPRLRAWRSKDGAEWTECDTGVGLSGIERIQTIVRAAAICTSPASLQLRLRQSTCFAWV